MTAALEPTIIPGRVRVGEIVQVIDQPDVKVFEVDLASATCPTPPTNARYR